MAGPFSSDSDNKLFFLDINLTYNTKQRENDLSFILWKKRKVQLVFPGHTEVLGPKALHGSDTLQAGRAASSCPPCQPSVGGNG